MKQLVFALAAVVAIHVHAEFIMGFGDPDKMTWEQKVAAYQKAGTHQVAYNCKFQHVCGSKSQNRRLREPSVAEMNAYIEKLRAYSIAKQQADEVERKERWIASHPGTTEADYVAWNKMSGAEKMAWFIKWRENHKSN